MDYKKEIQKIIEETESERKLQIIYKFIVQIIKSKEDS